MSSLLPSLFFFSPLLSPFFRLLNEPYNISLPLSLLLIGECLQVGAETSVLVLEPEVRAYSVVSSKKLESVLYPDKRACFLRTFSFFPLSPSSHYSSSFFVPPLSLTLIIFDYAITYRAYPAKSSDILILFFSFFFLNNNAHQS